jgi:hypothetical protein
VGTSVLPVTMAMASGMCMAAVSTNAASTQLKKEFQS